jgi:hypothetical protein
MGEAWRRIKQQKKRLIWFYLPHPIQVIFRAFKVNSDVKNAVKNLFHRSE